MNIGIMSTITRECDITGIGRVGAAITDEIAENNKSDSIYLAGKDIYHHLKHEIYNIPVLLKSQGMNNINFLLASHKIDVIHSYYDPFDFNGRIIKCGRILTIHDLRPLKYPDWSPKSVCKNFEEDIMVCAKKADYVIADSEYTKKDIIDIYGISPDRVITIYLGLYKPELYINELYCKEVTKLKNVRYILSVSGIDLNKNQIGLIKAFSLFKAKHPDNDIKLVLTGPVRNAGVLNECIDYCKEYMDDIVYTGYVSDEELAWLYHNAVSFIYPSFYEGFGLPILEAMSTGKSVMCSNTTSIPEVAGDAAEYFDPYDIESMLFTMENVLLSESKMKVMEKKSIVQAAKFSYKKAAMETMEIYKRFS